MFILHVVTRSDLNYMSLCVCYPVIMIDVSFGTSSCMKPKPSTHIYTLLTIKSADIAVTAAIRVLLDTVVSSHCHDRRIVENTVDAII